MLDVTESHTDCHSELITFAIVVAQVMLSTDFLAEEESARGFHFARLGLRPSQVASPDLVVVNSRNESFEAKAFWELGPTSILNLHFIAKQYPGGYDIEDYKLQRSGPKYIVRCYFTESGIVDGSSDAKNYPPGLPFCPSFS